MTPQEINDWLARADAAFREKVTTSIGLSQRAAGRQVDQQLGWSTWLFARVVSISVNIEKLLQPGPRDGCANTSLDFATVGSLCRDLIEACFTFLYVSEVVPPDVWRMRTRLIYVHDCSARRQLFSAFGEDAEERVLAAELVRLSDALRAEPEFLALARQVQGDALAGKRPRTMTNHQIVAAHALDGDHFRAMYSLFSSNVHTSPLSWLRMDDNRALPGGGGDKDKGYSAFSLEYTSGVLDIAMRRMEEVIARLG